MEWFESLYDDFRQRTGFGSLPADRTKADVDFLVEELSLVPGSKVLDLFSGTGRHSIECQFAPVNVPLVFGKTDPPLFGKDVPGVFGKSAPLLFGQNVPPGTRRRNSHQDTRDAGTAFRSWFLDSRAPPVLVVDDPERGSWPRAR